MMESTTKFDPKRPGRPKAPERGIRVSTWIPVSKFDALARYSREHDKKLSAVLRDSLSNFPPNQSTK